MIVQNVAAQGKTDISFTVPKNELAEAQNVIQPILNELGGQMGAIDEDVSKVSVVGMGMAEQTGVASRMFRALADADVNIQMITTSEIKISALVPRHESLQALRIVHSEFQLDQGITESSDFNFDPQQKTSIDAIDVIDRLQLIGMESLTIDDVILDDAQSRITVNRVPNQPGIASAIFAKVAEQEIFVDMIVQSYAHDQYTDVSFTVPRLQCDAATKVANQFKQDYGCDSVSSQENIAKLSVAGIGLRSHTGVALGTFEALSQAGINVEMINTSEVRVNVVISGEEAEAGLACLKKYFSGSLKS
ncbi:MAG: ACT domain-containing protein, partial [Planctomycetota bacterium]